MSLTISDISRLLAQIPLFSGLCAEEISRIARFTRPCELDKGERLFQACDLPQGFYVVASGQIKLSMLSAQGNEKIVEIINPVQSFGEAVMLLERPYPVSAEALSPAALLHISHDIVTKLIDSDPRFARKLMAGMAIRLHRLIQDIEAYSLRSGTQRVIGYLLQIIDSDNHGNECRIALPVSKQTLASRLNLTPETLSRTFHELTNAGLINVQGKRIHILDAARLADYQG